MKSLFDDVSDELIGKILQRVPLQYAHTVSLVTRSWRQVLDNTIDISCKLSTKLSSETAPRHLDGATKQATMCFAEVRFEAATPGDRVKGHLASLVTKVKGEETTGRPNKRAAYVCRRRCPGERSSTSPGRPQLTRRAER